MYFKIIKNTLPQSSQAAYTGEVASEELFQEGLLGGDGRV
jgi:hypothetical protein